MGVTRQELEQQLAAAREAMQAFFYYREGSSIPILRGPTEDFLAAGDRVLAAERTLAAFLKDQYAVPLDLGFHPDSGVSAPLLLQTENSAILTFSAVTNYVEGTRIKEGTAVVEFKSCWWSMFGYPNDEAMPGHPLWGKGLSNYGIFDVHNSQWARRKTEQNRVSFPDTKDSNARHLIFTFHDSTFECLCEGIKSATFSRTPFQELFAEISKRGLATHVGWWQFEENE